MSQKDLYAGSRICYIIEATTEYLISLLITGAYLAKLTTTLGFSDNLTAMLSSFVALGCSFQLFAITFFKKGRVKRRITFLHTLNQLFFMSIYVVPFLKLGNDVKTALFILLFVIGYFVSNIVFPPKINWFMSLVEDKKRGVFTSIKEAVSLISGIIFQLAIGILIDHFETTGDSNTSFIVCGITIFALMIIHTLSLIFAKEKESINTNKETNKGGFKEIITDKNIMIVIFSSVFWTICTHITTPFLGTYQIKELGFSMTFVGVLSFVYAVARIPFSFVFGKYADKYSFAKMLKICYTIDAISYLVAAFTRPENGHVMYTLYYILHAISMGGVNSAAINLIFDYVPPEKRSNALAVKQTIYGISGFVATVVATPLVSFIQKNGNMFLGINIYAQQVLAAISFIGIFLLIFYIDKTVLKIQPYNREND